MSPMIDQISIFSDVILAQQLFKDLKKSGKNGTEQDNSRILTFEDDEFIVERVTRVTVVNVRIRMIENSAIPFINLTYLNLSFNRISEINGISHLTNLRTLDLSHNKIFDLSPIKEMKFLEILRVENNLIESLKPLNNTVKLKQLLLGHNNIIWEELIYLENIENLDVINLSENPLDKKQKIFDFICAFQPSIRSIFGFKNDFNLKNISEKSHFNNSNSSSAKLENNLDVSNDIIISRNIDFFCTIDGKGMMARARAYAIKNEEKNDSKNKLEKKHQPVLEENTSRKSSENGVSTPDSVRSASPKRPPLSSVKKEKKKDNQNTLTLPNLNNLTTMGNSELNQISGITRKTSDISEKKNIKKLNLSDKLFFEAENVLLKSPLGSGRECSPGSYLEPIGETIRFGGNNYDQDAPIAYFTKNSENGYVRWSKNGITACSLENGKMFFSYKNGSIAGLLDSTGNGSIMNPAGKCVLLLTNQGKSVAKIIDKLGQTSKTYEKKIHDEDNSKSMDQNEKQKVEANRSNDINLGQNNLKIEKSELSSSITNEKKVFERNVPHVWNFDGLKMEFYPESWEIKVSVKTDEVACTFSSTTGCVLSKNNLLNKLPPKTKIKTKVYSDEDHSTVRTGIQSVLSKLDDILSDIK